MTAPPTNWDTKYLREHPFFAFGSMFNAYALINKEKGISINELEVIADRLFAKALELTKRAYNETQANPDGEVDIPIL